MTKTIPAVTDAEREVKKAPELAEGDWLAAGTAETDSPVQVLAALRYCDPENGPSTHIVYANPFDGRPTSWNLINIAWVTLASADEIAGAKDRAARRRLRDDLRDLAELVMSPGLPVERSWSTYLHVSTRAEVLAVAGRLDLGEPRAHGKGIAITWPAGRELYEDGLTVTWCTGEPEPARPCDDAGHDEFLAEGLNCSRCGAKPDPAADLQECQESGCTSHFIGDPCPAPRELLAIVPSADGGVAFATAPAGAVVDPVARAKAVELTEAVAANPGPCWHGEIAPGRDCPGSGPDCGPPTAEERERGERVEVGADGCGCPITEELRPNDASIDGTERVEHRSGCWNAPASAE